MTLLVSNYDNQQLKALKHLSSFHSMNFTHLHIMDETTNAVIRTDQATNKAITSDVIVF